MNAQRPDRVEASLIGQPSLSGRNTRRRPLWDNRGIRPDGGMTFVRSLGVAGLVAGVVGTGLSVGVAGGAVGMQALVRRLDDGGQVTGAGVRRRQEAMPRRRYRGGAVSGAARVRRDGGGGSRGGRRQGACQRRERRLRLQAVLADQNLHGWYHVACRQIGRFSFVFPAITIIIIVRVSLYCYWSKVILSRVRIFVPTGNL